MSRDFCDGGGYGNVSCSWFRQELMALMVLVKVVVNFGFYQTQNVFIIIIFNNYSSAVAFDVFSHGGGP